MARVAKKKAEDLEAAQTAQGTAQDAPEAAGGTDTTTEAEGPQQVVQQSGAQAQQNGLAKYQQLVGDLVSHGLSEQAAEKAAPAAPSSS